MASARAGAAASSAASSPSPSVSPSSSAVNAALEVLTQPELVSLISGFGDRKEVLALPCVHPWVPPARDGVWRALFERHWPQQWVAEAAAAVTDGGGEASWIEEYKRRHESCRNTIVEPTNSAIEFGAFMSMCWNGWAQGDHDWYFDGDDMTDEHAELILFNGPVFTLREVHICATGHEAEGDVRFLGENNRLERYQSKKVGNEREACIHDAQDLTFLLLHLMHITQNYFTVKEIMRILLLRIEEDYEIQCAQAWQVYSGDGDSDDYGAQDYIASCDFVVPYPAPDYMGLTAVHELAAEGGGQQVIGWEAEWGYYD